MISNALRVIICRLQAGRYLRLKSLFIAGAHVRKVLENIARAVRYQHFTDMLSNFLRLANQKPGFSHVTGRRAA